MNPDLVITIFWVIVVLTHLYLMIKYRKWSRQKFQALPKRATVLSIANVPLGLKESVDDINAFINHLNEHSRQTNIAHFWGYTAGCVAALIALILSVQTLVGVSN